MMLASKLLSLTFVSAITAGAFLPQTNLCTTAWKNVNGVLRVYCENATGCDGCNVHIVDGRVWCACGGFGSPYIPSAQSCAGSVASSAPWNVNCTKLRCKTTCLPTDPPPPGESNTVCICI